MNIEKLADTLITESESVTSIIGENIVSIIITGLLCTLLAFFGFKFLKIEICITGALLGYSIGMTNVAPLLGDSVAPALTVVLAIALGIVGALLSAKIYKIMVFLYVALLSFSLGLILFSLFLEGVMGGTIIILLSVLFAIVAAYIVCRFFKPLYIIFTAFGGMTLTASCIALLIAPESVTLIYVMLALGLIAGWIAAMKQFKSCQGIEF